MNVEHNPLPDLMALGYEAAIEPALWPEVVLGTAKAFDAAVVGFGVVDRRRDRDVFLERQPLCARGQRVLSHAAVEP
ncbi:MAG TPA: hypothetical protein VF886_13625, partial [Roseiarcus sp.]